MKIKVIFYKLILCKIGGKMYYKETINDNGLELYPLETYDYINLKLPSGFLEEGVIYEFYNKLVHLVNFLFRGEM